eukprot:5615865-Pleurochrysis_carterae.AAC.1
MLMRNFVDSDAATRRKGKKNGVSEQRAVGFPHPAGCRAGGCSFGSDENARRRARRGASKSRGAAA